MKNLLLLGIVFALNVSIGQAVLAHSTPEERAEDAIALTQSAFVSVDRGQIQNVRTLLDPRVKQNKFSIDLLRPLKNLRAQGHKLSSLKVLMAIQPKAMRHPGGLPGGHYTSISFGSTSARTPFVCVSVIWRYQRKKWYIHKVSDLSQRIRQVTERMKNPNKRHETGTLLCKSVKPTVYSYEVN